MDCEKIYISNSDLLSSMKDIADKVKVLNVDVIVAIERGGLPLATYLSSVLSIPLERIMVSFYKDTEKQPSPIVDLKNFDVKKYNNPIFIDDLIDSGETFKYIKETYGDVLYATICVSNPLKSSIYSFIKPKEAWIIFPWNTDNDGFDYSFTSEFWWDRII